MSQPIRECTSVAGLSADMKFYYDFHIHSCLSPCGDDDMTPFNIANMAKINGLNIIAVTDHNSCRNAAAVAEAAEGLNITVLAGMELTTSEDVHVLMLMPSQKAALELDSYVASKRMRVKNRSEIYGRQLVMDARDNIIGEESDLLIAATDIGVYETAAIAEKFGGVAVPAHIDRESNGLVSVLGSLSADMGFTLTEFSRTAKDGFIETYSNLGYGAVHDSDAHRLEEIAVCGGKNSLEFDFLPTTEAVIAALKSMGGIGRKKIPYRQH